MKDINAASSVERVVDRYGSLTLDPQCIISSGNGAGHSPNTGYNNCLNNLVGEAIDIESSLIQSISTPLFYGPNGELSSTYSYQIEPTNFMSTYQAYPNIIIELEDGIRQCGESGWVNLQNDEYNIRRKCKHTTKNRTQDKQYRCSTKINY
jgi:hypothetical protein